MKGMEDPAAALNTSPIRCIVKLGGAAITCKHEIEKINEENLLTVSSQLRQAMMTTSSSEKVPGMDWSKRPGVSEISTVGDFGDHPLSSLSNFIIVHGAGSFGHFQASRSGVHKGGLHMPLVKAGFVATRISVTSLNLEIVRALAQDADSPTPAILAELTTKMTEVLTKASVPTTTTDAAVAPFDIKLDGTNYALWSQVVEMYISGKDKLGYINGDLPQPSPMDQTFRQWRTDNTVVKRWLINSMDSSLIEGIPSIGMAPFACGWSTCERNMTSADISQVAKAIAAGFVPVLHGDAVLDDVQGCTILSGDVIIRHLAQILSPKYVVFLTDVLGVYDRPPTDPDAVLLREIAVDEDGSWSIVKPLQHMNKPVKIAVADHDTTGGMVTKISEAAMIARLGIDVYIVKAGTAHSFRVLKGEIGNDIPDDWLGTAIRFSKQVHTTFPMER